MSPQHEIVHLRYLLDTATTEYVKVYNALTANERACESAQSLLRELLLNIERAELRGTPLAAVHIVQYLADIEDALLDA